MKKYISHRSINLFIVFLGILTTGGFTSCNFLRVDDYFDDTMKFDSIFTKYEYLVQYMWGTSDQFPDESRILSDPVTLGPMATDEAFSSQNPEHGLRGLSYILGTINADNIGNYSMNIWSSMYKVIRKCNYILARKGEAHMNTIQDEEITGYTHMMRGYAYYNLI